LNEQNLKHLHHTLTHTQTHTHPCLKKENQEKAYRYALTHIELWWRVWTNLSKCRNLPFLTSVMNWRIYTYVLGGWVSVQNRVKFRGGDISPKASIFSEIPSFFSSILPLIATATDWGNQSFSYSFPWTLLLEPKQGSIKVRKKFAFFTQCTDTHHTPIWMILRFAQIFENCRKALKVENSKFSWNRRK
jgi:hypothetical protein